MTPIARKSDGRRIFTDKFKRQQIDLVLRGELTVAELSRKLGIARSLLHRWKRFLPQEDDAARWRAPSPRGSASTNVRDLQLMIGKQAMELEVLRGQMETLKRAQRPRASKP